MNGTRPAPAPSLREPGRAAPFTWVLAKIRRYGRFSSPLRNSKVFTFHHSSDDTPSVSHSLDSSLREGAGKCSHSPGYSLMSGVTGDFHRPYETQKFLHSTIHRKNSCEIENFPFHFVGICDRMGCGRGCSLKWSEFLSFSLLFFLFGKLAGLWIFLMGWIAETQAGQILTVFILYDTIFIVKVV